MRGSRSALVVLAALACSGEPAATDGGLDGGIDAGRDAARADAARRDVGLDASPPVDSSTDPEWVRIEGSPDDCYMEYALHPERVTRVEWLPCSAGLPSSCTHAVFEPPLQLRPSGRTGLWDWSRGRGLFIGKNGSGAGGTSTIALMSSDGVALVALHAVEPSTVACPGELAMATDTVSVLSDYFNPPVGLPRPIRVFRGPFDAWFAAPLPVGELATIPRLASVQDMLTSATVTVHQIVPRGYLLISRDGEPSNHTLPGGATPRAVIGDDVFWATDGSAGTRIFHSGSNDADDLVIDGVARGESFDSFATDGTTMVWTPALLAPDGRTLLGYAVMTAPYATTAADLVARRLPVDLPTTATSVRLGPGVVAYAWFDRPTSQGHLEVMQLSDGSRSRLTLPNAPVAWAPTDMVAWVTDDEVAVPAHSSADRTPTMLRIARSAFVPVP